MNSPMYPPAVKVTRTHWRHKLLWDVHDLSAATGFSTRLLERLVASGDVPHIRLSRLLRFDPAKIQEWIAAGCPHPAYAKQLAEGAKE